MSAPQRDLNEDQRFKERNEALGNDVRPPLDTSRETTGHEHDELIPIAMDLAHPDPLRQIHCNDHLRNAGDEGILAVLKASVKKIPDDAWMVEALEFLGASNESMYTEETVTSVQDFLNQCLGDSRDDIRVASARAFDMWSAGEHRTDLLGAIADSNLRVRWAVVRYFGSRVPDMTSAQIKILLDYLDAPPAAGFIAADSDQNGELSRREFPLDSARFDSFDHDRNDSVSREEWDSPVPSAVRADVFSLMLRIHEARSGSERPVGYNPYASSATQSESVRKWRAWADKHAESE